TTSRRAGPGEIHAPARKDEQLLASMIPPLDHGDLVALVVVVHLVHKRADQQQSTAGDALQVGRVGRVGKARRVEAWSLIADDVDGFGGCFPGDDLHTPAAIRFLTAALLD